MPLDPYELIGQLREEFKNELQEGDPVTHKRLGNGVVNRRRPGTNVIDVDFHGVLYTVPIAELRRIE